MIKVHQHALINQMFKKKKKNTKLCARATNCAKVRPVGRMSLEPCYRRDDHTFTGLDNYLSVISNSARECRSAAQTRVCSELRVFMCDFGNLQCRRNELCHLKVLDPVSFSPRSHSPQFCVLQRDSNAPLPTPPKLGMYSSTLP